MIYNYKKINKHPISNAYNKVIFFKFHKLTLYMIVLLRNINVVALYEFRESHISVGTPFVLVFYIYIYVLSKLISFSFTLCYTHPISESGYLRNGFPVPSGRSRARTTFRRRDKIRQRDEHFQFIDLDRIVVICNSRR